MEIKDIINIAAIVLSPIIAVLVTIFLQNRSDKKKEKIAIIKSLLSTGHYLYSDEIIRSYNLIDIVLKMIKMFVQSGNCIMRHFATNLYNTK